MQRFFGVSISYCHRLSIIYWKNIQKNNIYGELVGNSVNFCSFSQRFVQTIAKVAIFNIMYRRLPVNEEALVFRKFNHVPFVVCTSAQSELSLSKDPWLNIFCISAKAIEDAVRNNFLKSIYILMQDAEGTVLETYSLHFKYNPNSYLSYKDAKGKTPEEVQIASSALLKQIADLAMFGKLDSKTSLEIELEYTDDCPESYHTAGFEVALQPTCLDSKNTTVIANINTGWHQIIVRTFELEFPVSRSNSVTTKPLETIPSPNSSNSDMDITPPQSPSSKIIHDGAEEIATTSADANGQAVTEQEIDEAAAASHFKKKRNTRLRKPIC